jgi:hypothetical protein
MTAAQVAKTMTRREDDVFFILGPDAFDKDGHLKPDATVEIGYRDQNNQRQSIKAKTSDARISGILMGGLQNGVNGSILGVRDGDPTYTTSDEINQAQGWGAATRMGVNYRKGSKAGNLAVSGSFSRYFGEYANYKGIDVTVGRVMGDESATVSAYTSISKGECALDGCKGLKGKQIAGGVEFKGESSPYKQVGAMIALRMGLVGGRDFRKYLVENKDSLKVGPQVSVEFGLRIGQASR